MKNKFKLQHFFLKLKSLIQLILDWLNYTFNIIQYPKEQQPSILYIGEYFPVRIQRVLNLISSDIKLKKNLFISSWGYEPKLIGDVFDNVGVYRNKFHLLQLIKSQTNIQLIHAFEPKAEFQYYIKQSVKVPFIYDVQDIIITYYGYHPPLKWQKKNLKFEEKLINESDGFISYSLELNEAQRIYKCKQVSKKRLFFPLYCDELNFKSNLIKEMNITPRIVYIGGINSLKDKSSSNFLPLIKKLSNKSVELTIFPSPFSERLCFEEYKNLELIYKNFKINRSVPFKDLDLTSYDFGVVPFENEDSETYYTKNKYASTLKFFVYLEMGIPILISDYWAFPAWITKRYHLGIVTNFKDIENIDFKLTETEYKTIQENIISFRSRFSLQKNKLKMIEFYNYFLNSDK